MSPEEQPDVDDLARSMLELLGVHEHDESHEHSDDASGSWSKAPTFAADPQRMAAVQDATRQDKER